MPAPVHLRGGIEMQPLRNPSSIHDLQLVHHRSAAEPGLNCLWDMPLSRTGLMLIVVSGSKSTTLWA
jgi:hypothetical protein